MAELTDKQKAFCEYYVIDWNATQAAIKAGYSESSARQLASDTLSKHYIQEYIEEIQKDLGKLCGVSAARNILELKKMAYTDITDFKKGWLTEKDFEDLTEDQKGALSEIQYVDKATQFGTERIVKFKVHDKKGAIETLNKMLGYNAVVKTEVEIKETFTDDERARRIAALKDKIDNHEDK